MIHVDEQVRYVEYYFILFLIFHDLTHEHFYKY